MPNGADGRNRHFILDEVTEVEGYRMPPRDIDPLVVPERNRRLHGTTLQRQLGELHSEADSARQAQQRAGIEEGLGLRIEFASFPGVELAFESLAREHWGIELLNVRHDGDRTYATVFVPDGKLTHFERLIQNYLAEKHDSAGRLRDNKRLINTIREIRVASLRALWTDTGDAFPTESEDVIGWEVWLPVRQDRSATVGSFRRLAEAQEMRVAPGALSFPERTVLLVSASVEQMQRSILTLNSIAELRRAKETAEFFDSLEVQEQHLWMDDLIGRASFPGNSTDVPYVCLLDTGVSRGHPLLTSALAPNDLHTVEPAWQVGDNDGHGTEMAGLALAGDLTGLLAGNTPVEITHRLESVKLLPRGGSGGNDPQHHGHLTVQAVSRPEVTAPARLRVFAMAVTARDNRDRGRPSAWSSAVDSLAADSHGYGALTVGAYTELVRITEPDAEDYEPIAPQGSLSPFSTTLKPDVMFEGGNAAKDALGAVWLPSLSLLTTDHRPPARLFTTSNATSAATALAARLSVQVMAFYPGLWPETIRALVVHSAEWTDAMRSAFLPSGRQPTKADYRHLVQRCGFGVPDLARALWSVANSLTMVVQETLCPFEREPGRQYAAHRDMHLHNLPWPQDALEDLGDTEVELRVTLSYFIEPNPSERGRSRYRYESHGLRFDVKRPYESVYEFRRRINAAARNAERRDPQPGDDDQWLVGTQARHRGSLHSDIWRGSAADLASRGFIAVYPALGWWKTPTALERYTRDARYALVISIRAPAVDVDLYTEVANRVAAPVEVEV